MGNIYLSNELEHEIVRRGADVTKFVNEAVKNALSDNKEKKIK